MAKIFGTSGAWRELAAGLIAEGFPVESPRVLRAELAKLMVGYDAKKAQLFVEVGTEAAQMQEAANRARQDLPAQIAAWKQMLQPEIEGFAVQLQQLADQKGFLRQLFSRSKIRRLKERQHSVVCELARHTESLQRSVRQREQRLDHFRTHKTEIVNDRKRSLDSLIPRLENVLRSGELAGAEAELETIAHLKAGATAGVVEESVAALAVGAGVGGVVQLDDQEQAQPRRIA